MQRGEEDRTGQDRTCTHCLFPARDVRIEIFPTLVFMRANNKRMSFLSLSPLVFFRVVRFRV